MQNFAQEDIQILTCRSGKRVLQKAVYPFVIVMDKRDDFDPRNLRHKVGLVPLFIGMEQDRAGEVIEYVVVDVQKLRFEHFEPVEMGDDTVLMAGDRVDLIGFDRNPHLLFDLPYQSLHEMFPLIDGSAGESHPSVPSVDHDEGWAFDVLHIVFKVFPRRD